MQDQHIPNLIHCVEHRFKLRKDKCYFYIHRVFPNCGIQNIQVGHVVTHVNQDVISKTTTLSEMLAYLQEFLCIQIATPKSLEHRFKRIQNIGTNTIISRHGFNAIKRGEYIVVESILPTCKNSSIVAGYVLMSVNGYRFLGTTSFDKVSILLNTEVLRHVVCRTIQYARSFQVVLGKQL